MARVVPSGGTTSLLLEREAQVAALQSLVDGARSGGGRFVVIEGGAGIGKSRLLAEARALADSAGMRVLAARGGELEGEFAYGIVRQLFEPLLASASAQLRAELLTGPAALIERLLGASQPNGSDDAPADGSFAKVHGLYWLAASGLGTSMGQGIIEHARQLGLELPPQLDDPDAEITPQILIDVLRQSPGTTSRSLHGTAPPRATQPTPSAPTSPLARKRIQRRATPALRGDC